MHISPSQINTFRAEPLLWCFRYFYGYRQPDNPKMAAGRAAATAVQESAVGLEPWDTVAERANAIYNMQKNALWDDSSKPDSGAMAEQLRMVIKPFGKAVAMEQEIIGLFEGLVVKGFLDLVYDDRILELKTGGQLLLKLSSNESIQCAIYQFIVGTPVALARATEKKAAVITPALEEMTRQMHLLRPVIRNMRPYLEAKEANDYDKMLELTKAAPIIDPDGYRWDANTIELAEMLAIGQTDRFQSTINLLTQQEGI